MRRKYTDFLIQWKKHQKTRNLTSFRAEMNIDTEMYLLSVEDFREKENYHIVPVYAGFCV